MDFSFISKMLRSGETESKFISKKVPKQLKISLEVIGKRIKANLETLNEPGILQWLQNKYLP